MEENPDFERYLADIFQKVSISVAIAVIRTKPEFLNINEHVENVQKTCLQKWQNESEVRSFENKIIAVKQGHFLKQINNLLPSGASDDESDFAPDEWFPSIIDEQPNIVEIGESSSDNESLTEDNAEFMRAIIKLKFAVNSRKTLTLKRPSGYTNLPEHPIKKLKSIARSSMSAETDSGFDSTECNSNNFEKKTFSTSLLRYVTNSSDTDILIKKCMETVLSYVKTSLTKNVQISFNFWKDSVLENIFKTLKEVSIDDICSEAITSFVEESLIFIWNCEDINKHLDWEYQCTLLAELCNTNDICTNTIQFLINKIKKIINKIKKLKLPLMAMDDQCFIEKIPHFLDMTSKLLLEWKRLNKNTFINNKKNENFNILTNLWKENWYTMENDNDVEETDLEIMNDWKLTFEKLVTSTTTNFPLISFKAVELIQIVDTILQNFKEQHNETNGQQEK